jgi:hypothetical protein
MHSNPQILYPPQTHISNTNDHPYHHLHDSSVQIPSQYQQSQANAHHQPTHQIFVAYPSPNPQFYPIPMPVPSAASNIGDQYTIQICFAWIMMSIHILFALLGALFIRIYIEKVSIFQMAWLLMVVGSALIIYACYALNTGLTLNRIDLLRRAPIFFTLGGIANTIVSIICIIGWIVSPNHKDIGGGFLVIPISLIFIYVYYIVFSNSVAKEREVRTTFPQQSNI